MTLPNLVSFSGYARSGKDSAAELLVTRARFAKTYMLKPLEQSLLKMNPWVVDHKENTIERFADLHENLGFDATREFEEVQRLLQVGYEAGRDLIGRNVWINQVFEEVRTLMVDQDKKVALSGVMHSDELNMVRVHEGVSVWIERRGARPVRSPSGEPLVTPQDCDITVSNNGTLRDLYVNLVTALEEHTSEDK